MVLVAIGLANPGVPVTHGPVKVLFADTFTTNGDLIGVWYWIRDAGYAQYGRWNFSGLPTSTSDGFVYIRFDVLVTNKASGGSGYSTNVKIYNPSTPAKFVIVRLYNLHPEFQEPGYTVDGWGYQAMGWIKVPVTAIPPTGKISIELKRFLPNTEHVAVNQNACTIEWH